MTLELNKKYTFGRRTFWFLFLKNGKLATFSVLAIIASIVCIHVGETSVFVENFLASHFDGIVTTTMLTQWLVLILLAVIIFISVIMYEHHAQHKFMLDNHSFHIRRGILMVKEKVIPYRHIQNVDLEQPYHYRLFGVVRLNITTARVDTFESESEKNKKKHDHQHLIPLMDKKIAKELSHFLVTKGNMID